MNLGRRLLKRFVEMAPVLKHQSTMEFLIVSTAVGASVLLALSGTRVVLWVLMLGIMRDAAANSAAEN